MTKKIDGVCESLVYLMGEERGGNDFCGLPLQHRPDRLKDLSLGSRTAGS